MTTTMPSVLAPSVLAKVRAEHVRAAPYPYLVLPDALDPALFREMAPGFPRLAKADAANNFAYRIQARAALRLGRLSPLWTQFVQRHTGPDFVREAVELFGPHLDRLYPELRARYGPGLAGASCRMRPEHGHDDHVATDAAGVETDCQFVFNSPVTAESTVRGAHTDQPEKLFAGLLYCRAPDDDSVGGDLEILTPKPGVRLPANPFDAPRDLFDVVETIPYRANMLVFWINLPTAYHAVTPRRVTPHVRRYMNLLINLPHDLPPLFRAHLARRG
jgi:hypothetical protein